MIADNSQRFFLRQPLLWNEILHGTYRDRWLRLLRGVTERFVRERAAAGVAERLAAGVLVGEDRLQEIVRVVRSRAFLQKPFLFTGDVHAVIFLIIFIQISLSCITRAAICTWPGTTPCIR